MTEKIESLAGVNVLLMGPAGTGKTYSIGTIVDSGIEVFYLALESGLESLLGYYTDRGLAIPDNLHWHTLRGTRASLDELYANAKKVNTFSYDALTKMVDPDRNRHGKYMGMLQVLNEFTDDRTGENFGAVSSWGTNRAIVIDGLTGMSRTAMSMVIGGKPVISPSEWGVAQGQLETLLRLLTDDVSAHFILLAHVERETDLILGGVKLMVSTLGKALPPKLPSMFSDVILAARSGNEWTWDTASAQADVKTRNLPIQANIAPDFSQIVEKWKSRGGIATS